MTNQTDCQSTPYAQIKAMLDIDASKNYMQIKALLVSLKKENLQCDSPKVEGKPMQTRKIPHSETLDPLVSTVQPKL